MVIIYVDTEVYVYRKDIYECMLELESLCECHKSVKLILQRSWKTRILEYKMNMYMDKCVNLWENFSGVFECYSSILLSHFRETAIGNTSNYKPGKGQEKQEYETKKKTKWKKTENRKQVHMNTGNTRVGKFFV